MTESMVMSAQPESRRQANKQQRKNLYLIGTLVAGALMLAGTAIARETSGPVAAALVLPPTVAMFAFSLAWFAALDELAQRAHYVAWFWGGSIGLLSFPLLIIAALATGGRGDLVDLVLHHLGGANDTRVAFMNGVLAAILPPIIGYGIWWLVFWLRKL